MTAPGSQPAVVWCARGDALERVARDRPGHRAVLLAANVRSRADVMDAVASVPGVPDHFGRNWDAVADVLGELGPIDLVVEAPHLLGTDVWAAVRALGVDPAITVVAVPRPDAVSDTSPVGDG